MSAVSFGLSPVERMRLSTVMSVRSSPRMTMSPAPLSSSSRSTAGYVVVSSETETWRAEAATTKPPTATATRTMRPGMRQTARFLGDSLSMT